jgi:hypothetical protein
MLKAHSSKRKYNFETMSVGQIKKFEYADHGRIRNAVFAANKRNEGTFICRIVKFSDGKKVAVQRTA